MSNLFLSTAANTKTLGAATPPMPTSPGSLYLIGLLAKQDGLKVAKNALVARTAYADKDETRFINVQLGNIQSDYAKIDAMITAYLSSSAIVQPISQQGLARIRAIVEQLQDLVAKRDRASNILQLVTQLLNEWDGQGEAAQDAGNALRIEGDVI
ncbi:hypothetical protein [Pseudoduganella sp.]|uniref:hypothetical protein n=1 Tax=Pseudoduganella sp. TaxID=1880898 RepID=UPI0035B083DD